MLTNGQIVLLLNGVYIFIFICTLFTCVPTLKSKHVMLWFLIDILTTSSTMIVICMSNPRPELQLGRDGNLHDVTPIYILLSWIVRILTSITVMLIFEYYKANADANANANANAYAMTETRHIYGSKKSSII